jgi:hypothetical protein
MEAGRAGQVAAHSAIEDIARSSPRWIGLSDYIDTWDEHDRFWVGIRGPMFVSDAFAAEYGTDEYPPAPLFRLTDAATRAASSAADVVLRNRFANQGFLQ